MDAVARTTEPRPTRAAAPIPSRGRRLWSFVVLSLTAGALTGCAASHPLDGIPAKTLHPHFCAPQRDGLQTVDLALLRQVPPPEHLVDSGDVLGVYVDGYLGNPQQGLPVYQPQNPDLAPSTGYPVQVRGDGTISLPVVGPLPVRGLTIPQVEQVVKHAYTHQVKGFQPDASGILVSLQKPRSYRVLVIRQEAGNDDANLLRLQTGNFQTDKLGTGRAVTLPVYRNDVLNALAETGGLPGLDAENVIYVIRGGQTMRFAPGPVVLPHGPVMAPPPEPRPLEVPVSLRPVPEPSAVRLVSATDDDLDVQAVRRDRHAATPRASDHPLGDTSWRGGSGNGHQAAPMPRIPDPLGYTAWRGGAGHSLPQNRLAEAMAEAERELTVPRGPLDDLPDPVPVRPRANALPAAPAPLVPRGLPLVRRPSMSAVPLAPMTPLPSVTMPWNGPYAGPDLMVGPQVIRIPLRVSPDECPVIRPEDVILHDGDIVFIESRRDEFFFTGGLLGGGQYLLPRDYDLNVIGAITIAEAQSPDFNLPTRAVAGISALNHDVTVGASKVIVFRKLPGGGELPIEIDLYRAMRHPDERIVIQPGDRIILQYTRPEAFAAFFERHVFEATVIGVTSAFRFGN